MRNGAGKGILAAVRDSLDASLWVGVPACVWESVQAAAAFTREAGATRLGHDERYGYYMEDQ